MTKHRGRIVFYDIAPAPGGFVARAFEQVQRGAIRFVEGDTYDVGLGPVREDPNLAMADTWMIMNTMAHLGVALHTGRKFSPYDKKGNDGN